MDAEERKDKLKELIGKTSIGDVAKAAGVNHNTIRYALKHGTMGVETLQKIAKALGVHPSMLV